jgi:DnaJ-class molecular chaperone
MNCEKCHGNGEITCYKCQGHSLSHYSASPAEEHCSNCNGTGEVHCTHCYGNGIID